MSWTQIGSDDPGWTDDTSASAQTWPSRQDGTEDLWNRLGPRTDEFGGTDFVSVLGGGWVLGTGRNTIELGSESPERKP